MNLKDLYSTKDFPNYNEEKPKKIFEKLFLLINNVFDSQNRVLYIVEETEEINAKNYIYKSLFISLVVFYKFLYLIVFIFMEAKKIISSIIKFLT